MSDSYGFLHAQKEAIEQGTHPSAPLPTAPAPHDRRCADVSPAGLRCIYGAGHPIAYHLGFDDGNGEHRWPTAPEPTPGLDALLDTMLRAKRAFDYAEGQEPLLPLVERKLAEAKFEAARTAIEAHVTGLTKRMEYFQQIAEGFDAVRAELRSTLSQVEGEKDEAVLVANHHCHVIQELQARVEGLTEAVRKIGACSRCRGDGTPQCTSSDLQGCPPSCGCYKATCFVCKGDGLTPAARAALGSSRSGASPLPNTLAESLGVANDPRVRRAANLFNELPGSHDGGARHE